MERNLLTRVHFRVMHVRKSIDNNIVLSLLLLNGDRRRTKLEEDKIFSIWQRGWIREKNGREKLMGWRKPHQLFKMSVELNCHLILWSKIRLKEVDDSLLSKKSRSALGYCSQFSYIQKLFYKEMRWLFIAQDLLLNDNLIM